MKLVNLCLFALICEDSDSNLIFASLPKKAIHRRGFDHQIFPKLLLHRENRKGLFHNDWMIGVVCLETDFQENVLGNVRFRSEDQLEDDVGKVWIIRVVSEGE